MLLLPQQKLSRSEKNKEWKESCIDFYIRNSEFNGTAKEDLYRFYRIANGNIDENDFNYVTNPYNSSDKSTAKKGFPAKLRNYNIIKPVIDLLLGEKAKRTFPYKVVAMNSDVATMRDTLKSQEIAKSLKQEFVNELIRIGIPVNAEEGEVQDPVQVAKEMDANPRDRRAIIGQETLDYLYPYCEVEDKWQTGFYDWLVTGEVYSYKEPYAGDLEYEIVPPTEIFYKAAPGIRFVEDADSVVRVAYLSPGQVIDRFNKLLSDEDLDQINKYNRGGELSIPSTRWFEISSKQYQGDTIEVIHVCWKSQRKMLKLTYINEIGEIVEEEVDESYPVDKSRGEKVEEYWVNEVWEGYRIDGSIYVGIQPRADQRHLVNNSSKCKLPYNGRCIGERNSDNPSIVSLGMPYQILYIIFHYRFEMTMAKNKDKIVLVPKSLIPNDPDWGMDHMMYFADALGFLFVDDANKDQIAALQQVKILDASLSQYANAMYSLTQTIKAEWEESIGITRQRKGQVMASDGKGTTDSAIFQSSIITEELFRKFEKWQQRELQGLIDVAKYSWAEGLKSMYVSSDGRIKYIDIDGADLVNADLGVFVTNSQIENEKLNVLKQLAAQFAQNKQSPYTVAEILDSNNFSKIKEKLRELEAAEKMLQAQMEEQQSQMAVQQEQMINQREQMKLEHESREKALDRQNKIDVELIKADIALIGMDNNANGIDDGLEIEKRQLEREKILSKEKIEQAKLNQQERMKEKEIQVKEKDIEAKKYIASKNKNKYDK